MPNITLTFKGQAINYYPIHVGKTLTIGRKPENDLVIDNLAVSGNHATIEGAGNGFILIDLQSKNGTFVNEKMITSHPLAHGDVITIGKHQLKFEYAKDEERPVDDDDDLYQTMVMDTSEHRALLDKNKASSEAIESSSSDNQLPPASLSFLAGGEGEVAISKKLFKIGKSAQSDLQIGGLFTGQTAATISQRPSGYYLSYASGISKPKVNGEIIKTSVLLKEFDLIEIGKDKLQLILKNN